MSEELFDDEEFGGVGYSPDNEAEVKKKQEAAISGPVLGPRIRIENGLNRFWVLPSTSKINGTTIRTAEVHYGPHHACGRGDWVINEKGEVKKDGKFNNCIRCITAWNLFDENLPKPEGGSREKETPNANFWGNVRRKGMSNSQGIIQVVNLTPFYKQSADGTVMTADKKKLALFDTFVGIINGTVDPDSLDEDFPKDVLYSARCGVQTISLDENTAKEYTTAYRKAYNKNVNKEPALSEPSKIPHIQLCEIRRYPDTKASYMRKGVKVHPNLHSISFEDTEIKKADMPNFKDLLRAIKPKMINIHEPSLRDDEIKGLDEAQLLEAKAHRLMHLNEEEMLQYLENCKHTYVPEESDEVGEEGDDEPAKPAAKAKGRSAKKPVVAVDPDAFEDSDFEDDDEEEDDLDADALSSIEDMKAAVEAELND
jgi:hypothetical protein